ncbi:helix-turn-helix transcriptional regulator [Paenibacillus hexagrammi]|uniref:AraC family transcriptional regulator n=1 Tax=Paenibacillus hexagrammi TaxID=2908839 RepID=A0ABY3SNW0_9BACL|nr:AraC family transcriptional regulator [Paenibacillus sp. YPD9-1]UJF34896.1 AraC family transcriptional regulator [Paenibacillus sp. YPD9-1]
MLKRRGSFYRNSLVMMMLIASIPGIVMGLITYWTVTNKIEGELQRLHRNKIIQQEKNVEAQFANLEMTFSHWAFELNLGSKLKNLSFVTDYNEVHELYRTLLIIEGSNPLIEKASLYLSTPRPVVMNKEGYEFQDDLGTADAYSDLMKREKSMYWMDAAGLPGANESSDGTTLTLVNKLPGGPVEPYGLLIATLNKSRLEEQLKTLNPLGEGSTLLLNGDQQWKISSNGQQTDLDVALENEYRTRGSNEDSFLFTFNKAVYSVSISQFTRLGMTWVFLSADPLSGITAPVLLISKVILFVSVGGLLLALLLSWMGSRRIYSPLERLFRKINPSWGREGHRNEFEWIEMKWESLTQESEKLRSKLDLQLPVLREGFLMQLVQGYLFELTESDVHERCKQFGLDVAGKQVGAAVVQMRGLNWERGVRFSQGDDELVAFAAGNIAKELSENMDMPCEILNFHDMTLGVFIAFPLESSTADCKERMREFGEELLQMIQRILKLQAVIVTGNTTSQISHVPYLFEETKQLLNFWDLKESNTVIDVAQLHKSFAQLEFPYHFMLEKELIHAIRVGAQEEAAKLVRQFMDELTSAGVKKLVLQQGITQLVGSIQHAMLQSGINPISLFNGANLYQELNQLNEPDEMLRWLETRIVGAYVQELVGKQDFQTKQVVENVLLYIQENYNSNISLESCADEFGTSPYSLSRAIKQVTGINFIDYLTNLRMDQARELLRTTSLKISEVADRVGYQHTYFNRIFKKIEGVSPGQYRELAQKDS